MIVFIRRLAFGRPRSHAISDKLEQWPAGPYIENAYRRSRPRLLSVIQNRGFGPALKLERRLRPYSSFAN